MRDLATFQSAFIAALAEYDDAPTALDVYRNTIARGATEALAANFPVVRALVGEGMFTAIGHEFAEVSPPRSAVLADYGRGFPGWIEEQPWAPEIGYVADVAALERLHVEALFAPDAPALTVADLADVAPEAWDRTVLRLHPATRFAWTKSPAMEIWLAHVGGRDMPRDERWSSQGGLFVRPANAVAGRVLDPAGHRFLFGLRLGETVAKAALASTTLYPAVDVGGLFASFVAEGAFANLTLKQRI